MSLGPTKRDVMFAIAQGLLWCLMLAAIYWAGSRYIMPAKVNLNTAAILRPIVEGGYIKVPLDISRDRECLSQATLTLRRMHDYGGSLGVRLDIKTLELYNTTITGPGDYKVMLWFVKPPGLYGLWDWDGKAQDDCGGFQDPSIGKPREAVVRAIDLGPEP